MGRVKPNSLKSVILLIMLLGITEALKIAPVENKSRMSTLKLVQVIFRHGDRAPTKFYPTDPYINDFDKLWPEGFAQLTNKGKVQQYELGKFLRNRYDGHLAQLYSPSELYVISSDMDRTIMSLESNLAGLFPPVTNPWHLHLDWQPIPLRTIPRNEDKFLHNSAKCPRYHEIRSKFFSSSEVVLKLNKEHEQFIKYCAEHSGLDISTAKGLYPLLDILYAQASHNYTLPKWAQGDTLQKLLDIHGVVNTWPTYTSQMKRLSGGPFLSLLVRNIQTVSGHLPDSSIRRSRHDIVHSVHNGINRKMLMYSAHDSTLTRIMNTMGIFDPHCPPYASALMIELHQDQDTMEYFIEFHYRNDTTREPFVLTHPQCGHPCKLQTYLDITQPLIPVNWEKECKLDTDTFPINTFAEANFLNGEKHRIEDDDNEDVDEVKNVLRSDDGFTSFDKSWLAPDCITSSSELLIVGLGFIIASIFSTFMIVKLLKPRRSYGRPLFVELISSTPVIFNRFTYEQL